MKELALFLISSLLTPATLAAGQTRCLLATQIRITSAVSANDSPTGLIVISSSSGSCIARSIDVPLLPVTSRQTVPSSSLSTTKSNAAAVTGSLLTKLRWTEASPSETSRTPAGYGRSRGADVFSLAGQSQETFSAETPHNIVLRF